MNKEGISEIPVLIQELYSIVNKLEEYFPGRHFTPDGHLVGSIGEVLGAYYYGLELLPASSETHDAETIDKKKVQIKATQKSRIGIRSQPEYLLVLKINISGKFEEIYNGPGKLAWDNAGKMQANGQRPISVLKLKQLMKEVKAEDRLTKVIKEH